jgi:hypothetical protein
MPTQAWAWHRARSEVVPAARLAGLRDEVDELIAIFVASINTAKKRKEQKR